MNPKPIAVYFGDGFKNQNITADLHLPRAGRNSSINIKLPTISNKNCKIRNLKDLRKSLRTRHKI